MDKKTKQKLFLGIGLFLTALSLAVFSAIHPASAAEAQGTGFLQTAVMGLGYAFTWLIVKLNGIIFGVVVGLLLPVVKTVLSGLISNPNIILNTPVTQEIWTFAQAITNSIFLAGLLIAALAIILRINTGVYQIKKFLGSFLIAAVLANVSLLMFRAILDLGSIITNAILSIMSFDQAALLSYLYQYIDPFISNANSFLSADLANSLYILVSAAIVSWILIKLIILLVERALWMFMLMISAPVVFALSILPNMQKFTSQWWDNLVKWTLAIPLIFFFIVASKKIIGDVDIPSFFTDPNTIISTTANSADFIRVIIGLFVLYLAGTVPNMLKLGGVSGGGMFTTPQSSLKAGKGAVQGAWKNVVTDTTAGKNLAGQAYFGARRQLLSGSYDKIPGMKSVKDWAINREAQRQRTTGGLRGMLFNPKGRGSYMEATAKRSLAFQQLTLDSKDASRLLPTLGTDWDSLDKTQQKARIAGNPRLKDAADRLKAIRGAAGWRARSFVNDTNIADLDPARVLGDKALSTDEKDRGEAVTAVYNLNRIATSRTHPESQEARRILQQNADKLTQHLGIDVRSLIKGTSGPGYEAIIKKLAKGANGKTRLQNIQTQLTGLDSRLQSLLQNNPNIDKSAPVSGIDAQFAADFEKFLADNNLNDILPEEDEFNIEEIASHLEGLDEAVKKRQSSNTSGNPTGTPPNNPQP